MLNFRNIWWVSNRYLQVEPDTKLSTNVSMVCKREGVVVDTETICQSLVSDGEQHVKAEE